MITQTLIVTLLVVATVSGHGQTLQPQANENQAIAQELRRLFDELRVALAKRGVRRQSRFRTP